MNYFKNRAKQYLVEKKNEISSVPKNALVELTNACNHSCVFCFNPTMERKISSLDINKFESFIVKSTKEGLLEVGLYSTGEPFMTKNLEKFIKIAKFHGIKRVYITTNGALATKEKVEKCLENGLDSIKFSINASTRENYKIIHGKDDFEKVIKNLKNIYDLKLKKFSNLQLLCSFVYTSITKNEVKLFKEKYAHFFEDVEFVPAVNQAGRTFDRVQALIDQKDQKLNAKNFEYQPCEMVWNRLHLTSEGYLTACCVDYENDLVFEKYDETKSIYDQFNNEKIKSLRKKHLENNLDGTICKNCIYNTNEKFNKIDDIEVETHTKSNSKKLNSLKKRLNLFYEKKF